MGTLRAGQAGAEEIWQLSGWRPLGYSLQDSQALLHQRQCSEDARPAQGRGLGDGVCRAVKCGCPGVSSSWQHLANK